MRKIYFYIMGLIDGKIVKRKIKLMKKYNLCGNIKQVSLFRPKNKWSIKNNG